MINLNKKQKKLNIGKKISKNTPILIFVFIILYSILFFLTFNNFSPEFSFSSLIIFIVPTIAIIFWVLKIIYDKLKRKPGSGLTLRLTIYFLIITSIPFIMLFFNSNKIIENIYEKYISLKGIQEDVKDIIELIIEKTDSKLEKDISKSIEKFYSEIIFDEAFNISSIYTIDIHNADYIVIFKVNKYNETKIIIYFTKKEHEQNIQSELNINILEKILVDNKFYQEEITNSIKENTLNQGLYYVMPSIEKNIFFKIKYLSDFNTKSNDSNLSNLVIKENEDVYIIGIQYVSSIDDSITQSVSELSGKINSRSDEKSRINIIQKDLNGFILYFSIPITIVAIILSFYLTLRFTRPMESLIKGTKAIATGDLKYRIKSNRNDELGLLIDAFNKMADELEQNKFSLFRAEKAAAWREVARKLAHEIKNPLTPIRLASERIKRQHKKNNPNINDIIETCTSTIIEEVDRLNYIIQEFSEFARNPVSKKNKENIISIITLIINSYSEIRPNIKFVLNNFLDKNKEILLLDKKQIKQVFINLFENSVDVLPEKGGKIEVNLTSIKINSKLFCIIEIIDNGKGIPQDVQNKIFKPYFTTKEKGTGLGLVIVENIIEEHNGKIYFQSKLNEGTNFYIKLPIII